MGSVKPNSLCTVNDLQSRIAVFGDVSVPRAVQTGLTAGREKITDLADLKLQLELEPDNPQLWAAVATREALLGNQEVALTHAKKAVELRPIERDRQDGPVFATVVAFVYAWTGDKDRALIEYARLLRTPFSRLNVHEMKVHPRYAPLHGDPRFEALLNDPTNNEPLF
jgi:hypothetical protein